MKYRVQEGTPSTLSQLRAEIQQFVEETQRLVKRSRKIPCSVGLYEVSGTGGHTFNVVATAGRDSTLC